MTNRFRVALLGLLAIAALIATDAHGQLTRIPLTTRRDMVFDKTGQYLYISTSDGYVHRYNLTTNQFDNSYNLGGSLNGVDIAADDSFLLVAQNNGSNGQGTVHRIDLTNGAITNINYPLDGTETGAWAIAIASNGVALVTPQTLDSYAGHVRQIDLATNTVTVRSDVPGSGGWSPNGTPTEYVHQHTQLHRSADRTRLYFVEGAPVFIYDATTNTFGPRLVSGTGNNNSGSAAVSRDGSLLLTRGGSPADRTASLDRASDSHFIRGFHNTLDTGVAFDAVSDTIYAINSSALALVAYDTNTFGERFRRPITEVTPGQTTQFGTGNLIADQNGRYLAHEMSIGIDLYTLPTPLPGPLAAPASLADPRDIVFDNAGTHLYISTGYGFVFPFNLVTRQLETPYNIGGALGSIDISPDDSTLLVGQGIAGLMSGVFHKINLATGTITNIEYERRVGENLDSEGGAGQLAIAGNGLAIATVSYSGGPMTQYFRQIDLATNSVAMRSDTPPNTYPAFTSPAAVQLYPSADRSLIYCMQLTNASETYNYYSTTNQFGPVSTANDDPITGAANRDATLIARRTQEQPTTLLTAGSFSFVHSFDGLEDGLAFNGANDVLYGVSTATDEIIGYNTNTFAEQLRLPIGEDMPTPVPAFYRFGSGRLVGSHDGRYLALITPSAIRIFDVTAPIAAAPIASPNGGSFKKKVAIKLSSSTPGASVYFTIDGGYPNTSSNVYAPGKKGKAGITIVGKGTYTLRAISIAPGYNDSAVATAVFTIK